MLIAAFLALFVPRCLRRWRLTPAGATAVDSLRSYGYGPAGLPQGLHPDTGRTVWALDGTGAAPLPKDRAWSSLGGQWHTVQLGQILTPAFWSTKSGLYFVLTLTFIGSFISLMIGGLAYGLDPEGKLIAIMPSALAAFVITTCWLPAYDSRCGCRTPSPSPARSSSCVTLTAAATPPTSTSPGSTTAPPSA